MKKTLKTILFSILPLTLPCNDEIQLINLTEEKIHQNPSGIYELNLSIQPKSTNIIKKSIQTFVVIDGVPHPMTPAPHMGPNAFTFDYAMPNNGNHARYYYEVTFDSQYRETKIASHTIKSELYDIHLINRYVTTLESSRGPVGATIAITGRGFQPTDTIILGNTPAKTHFVSPNAIQFEVPPLPGGCLYDLSLSSSNAPHRIGEFRIDPSKIHSNLSHIHLSSNDSTTLTFNIDRPAHSSGLPLEITTDIPNSIIMPETSIPGGMLSTSVTIQGDRPGSGHLFIQAPGFDELQILVTVSNNNPSQIISTSQPSEDEPFWFN